MLVVMQSHALPGQVEDVVAAIRRMGLTPHPMPGATRTAIGITGNIGAVDPRTLEVLPGVMELIRVTKPYKLASREMHEADTYVRLPQSTIGPGTFTLIAGPCSVENEAMIQQTAEFLVKNGVRLLRAGAFKPRTSPYAFQGMGLDGLQILKRVRERTGIGIVTELMDTDNADAVEEAADVIQIGARNMSNFSLLSEVGRAPKPVLLKRGLSSTVEDLLMAAEYIVKEGNSEVILCERGIKTFETSTRFTLDIGAIPVLKMETHLPVIVDPSHPAGRRELVLPLARAAVAAGADGIIVEVHPRPEEALCDAAQQIPVSDFPEFAAEIRALVSLMGRTIG
jgi:3-deoxy-7-phosphoheptulonate synthase